MDPELLRVILPTAVALVAASGGAAWAGVKVALNGTVSRVIRVEEKVDQLGTSHENLHRDFVHLKGQLGAP